MDWMTIEAYDKLKKKPHRCVFFVEESLPSSPYHRHAYLPATVVLERNYGSRKVTHWLELPTLPNSEPRRNERGKG